MFTSFLVHLRRQWMGALALFLVLTGGAAYAANTVFSQDIVNGEVKSVDIGDNQVQGVDVRDRSLSGADLGVRVRGSKQPDAGPAATCGREADFDECTTVVFNLPRAQRLLLVGSAEWIGLTSAGGNHGECRFSVGNLAELGLRKFGESGSGPSNPNNVAMNAVTGILDQGIYEIGIDCRNTSPTGGGMTVKNAELSVVAIGDG